MVKKFTIPFASQGDANDIPDALQVDGKVSFTQGFGYDYERPYDDPQAKDIAREDMNGLFKAITSAVGELQTLGASEWSSAISYPKGAIVYYEKDLYISQVDDNQNKPPQSWVSITSIANDSLKKAMNLSDLTNKATARANLELGNSATLNKTDVLGTSSNLVATQKLVNDTKVNLENSINSIENTSKTFLVKSNNLSDLTNKSTARTNLGLGTSATLNKTDVLGTSTSLVATQKLVNDTKINLESSKQDKLTFTGTGNVARMSEVDKKRDLNNNKFDGRISSTDGIQVVDSSNNPKAVFHVTPGGDAYIWSHVRNTGYRFVEGGDIPSVQQTAALGNEQWTDWAKSTHPTSGDSRVGEAIALSYAMMDVPAGSVVCRTESKRFGTNDSRARVLYRRIIRTGR